MTVPKLTTKQQRVLVDLVRRTPVSSGTKRCPTRTFAVLAEHDLVERTGDFRIELTEAGRTLAYELAKADRAREDLARAKRRALGRELHTERG